MRNTAIQRLMHDLLDVAFYGIPRKDSEYWLFGGPAVDAETLHSLPTLLGFEWAWQGEELVVDYIDGPYSGETDLLTWSELAEALAESQRLLVRWAGCRLPVRVLVCPGLGVEVAIEHMDQGELQMLHRSVVKNFVGPAVQEVERSPVLIGCDTLGVVEVRPELILAYKSSTGASLLCPDFLLGDRDLVGSTVELDSDQTIHEYDELQLTLCQGAVPATAEGD